MTENQKTTQAKLYDTCYTFMLMYVREPEEDAKEHAAMLTQNITKAMKELDESFSECKSFSELIIEGSRARKQCLTCGQWCVCYKRAFEHRWITAIRILRKEKITNFNSRELALMLVAEGINPTLAYSLVGSFNYSRNWGLIRKTEQRRDYCDVYEIEKKMIDFDNGEVSLPRFLWIPTEKIEFDTGSLPHAEHVFKKDILPDDPDDLADEKRYIEDSVSTLSHD